MNPCLRGYIIRTEIQRDPFFILMWSIIKTVWQKRESGLYKKVNQFINHIKNKQNPQATDAYFAWNDKIML